MRIKFLFCTILPELICIWNDVYEIMCKHFRKEHSCALQDFLCVLVSRLVCARAQLRGNIVDDLFSQVLAFGSCAAECIKSARANNKNVMNYSTLLFSSNLFPVSMIQCRRQEMT